MNRHQRIRRAQASCLLVCGLLAAITGCGINLPSPSASANGPSQVWRQLQQIERDGLKQIQQLQQDIQSIGQDYDVDRIAGKYSEIAEQHAELAHQLKQLDTSAVSQQQAQAATTLVDSHGELATQYKAFAAAAKDRNFQQISEGQVQLMTLSTQHVKHFNDARQQFNQ